MQAALRATALAAVVLVSAACGGAEPEQSRYPAGSLRIESPATGSVVSQSTISVKGHAPAGARVVEDIRLGSDKEVIAGTDGAWELTVDLDNGANDLVFRLGDDKSTEIHLGVTFTAAGPTPAPIVAPTPTPAPIASPKPTTAFKTFTDGTLSVGSDAAAGTYRLREPAGFCYWARLKGFSGELSDIIANENVVDAYGTVTIGKTDAGFESDGCGEWTSDLSQVTTSKSQLTQDGTYIVGTDLTAGTWRASGGDACYWARLSGFGGTLGAIIANDNVFGGSTIVTIKSTDKGFLTNGCGTWTRK